MLNCKSTLVVGAHPDDELLGCGGTVARLLQAGAEAHALVLSGITTSRDTVDDDARNEFALATKTLGFTSAERLDFPDNRFDSIEFLQIVKAVERIADKIRPDLVLTHDHTDLNIDHRLTHEAVLTAFRPAGADLRILAFETVSGTEWSGVARPSFQPTCYVNIESFLEVKLSALACYKSEMRDPPHPRSLEGVRALAHHRGFQASAAACEAFRHIRTVIA